MNKEEICFMPAYEMADKIKRQELTSQEITEVIIERIEKINPIINAYCTPTFDLARDMAKKADEAVKKGEKLGFLHGIPTSIKDETETKGIRTTFGCKIFENNVPHKDEIAVKRLRDAGIVILGKTNTPAFGYKGVTDNLIFGATKNPWNLERTCGGSSGGAAASMASGLGGLALGSDGGGSIRLPSCFCGVYGLKPNFGRVPHITMKLAGNLGTFVHKGPIVRYVKDAALMLDAIAGEDDSDRYSLPKPNFSYLKRLKEKPNRLNIGYSLDLGFIKALDPEVKKSVLDAVQKFEKLDWIVEKGRIRMKNPEKTFLIPYLSSFAYMLKPFLKEWKKKLDPGLVMTVGAGLKFSAQDLKIAQIQREMIYDSVCRHFKKYDILVTPTLACPAFKLGILGPNEIDGKKISPPIGWLPYTYPFNMTGHPAASIPCGWSSEGLPIGMQIVGRRFDELTVLQVSKAFEEIQPWQDKKPQFN
jgi:Asp-tRNA(Asn)/Glu-tRNA(Gln) amidotransferase A subunit family amidase